MSRDKSRERDRDRMRDRGRDRSRERDTKDSRGHHERDRDRDRDRDRTKDRHGRHDHDRSTRDRHRADRERDGERERHREKHPSRDHRRDVDRERGGKADDEAGRKRHREEPTAEEKEAADKKRKQDEQAALDDEMERRRKRVEEWRQRKLAEQQAGEAAAAEQAAAAAVAAAAAPAAKVWSLEDEEDDEEEPQPEQAPSKDVAAAGLSGAGGPGSQPRAMSGDEDMPDQEQQEAPGEEDEDEIDPLDAFMAAEVMPEVAKVQKQAEQVQQQEQQQEEMQQLVDGGEGADGQQPLAVAAGPGPGSGRPTAAEGRKKKAAAARKRIPRYYDSETSSDDYDEEEDSAESDDEEWARNVTAGKLSKGDKLAAVDHATMNYPPFRKNFYIELPETKRMTEEQVVELRKELDDIKVRGKDCPRPIRTWTQAGLNSRVLEMLRRSGFDGPLAIQAQALPIIMSGRDCIGIAKTGSGKTLAFVLPMVRHIKDQPPLAQGDGPIGLIMAPTRELVQQIAKEARRFAKPLDITAVAVFGGSGVANQISDLKRGAEIVAATPGRLIDLLVTGAGRIINLRRVTYLVLDEADRMFDMGFEPQIMRIVNNIRPDRQTVMFSATFPRNVETLARQALKDPVEIQVGGRSVVNADIEQCVEIRPDADRFLRLLEVLGEWFERGKIIIFVHSQDKCDNLFRDLLKAGYPCLSLHGGKDQSDRECTISDFKNSVCNILVATSVAARGLDVKELVLVVNYDVPNHHEDYVHRVGRTGRAGNKGTAITFIGPDEERYAPDLVKALKESSSPIPQDLQAMADSFNAKRKAGLVQGHGSGFGGTGFKFDKEEDQKIKQARKAKAKEFGIVDQDEEEEDKGDGGKDSDEDIRPVGTAAAAAAATAAAAASAASLPNGLASFGPSAPGIGGGLAPSAAKFLPAQPGHQFPGQAVPQDTSSILVAAQEAARAAAQRLGGDPSQPGLLAAAQQAAMRAAALAAAFAQTPGGAAGAAAAAAAAAMGTGPMPGGSGITLAPLGTAAQGQQRPSGFEAELEINDFPQQARWKVTHKGFQAEITELTGAAVTTKGIYVKSGEPPEGERRLYLQIEGPTEQAVRKAKQEIKKVLEELTEKAMRRDTGAAGRYNV